MTDFLPKDPTEALTEVKQMLYRRLDTLRRCIENSEQDDWGYVNIEDHVISNEISFLEIVLDTIEKS